MNYDLRNSSEDTSQRMLNAIEPGSVCALNIPAGTWHTLRSLESGTVILEVKDGTYEPIQDCDILK